ncbi:HlyD family efflux transporter periplasmic adaptor subunit [Spirosoma areae]
MACSPGELSPKHAQKIREDISLKELQLTSLQTRWRSESLKLTYEAEESLRLLGQSRAFYKVGDVSKNDLNQAEANSLKARNAYEAANQTYLSERSALTKQIATQRLEISSIDKQISKNQNDIFLEAKRLRNTVLATKKRISGSFGAFAITDNNHLLLKAPKSGTVSFVFDGEKEAQAGAILAKLVYKDAPLYAHIQVISSQIGNVKTGQSVVMKVDAFPVYEWGAVTGQIANVSLTPDEKGLFTVRVKITDYHHLKKLIRIGMKGTSSLIFEDETLFGYVFRKFRRVTSQLSV